MNPSLALKHARTAAAELLRHADGTPWIGAVLSEVTSAIAALSSNGTATHTNGATRPAVDETSDQTPRETFDPYLGAPGGLRGSRR